VALEVFAKLKQAIKRINSAMSGGAISAAGGGEGKRPEDKIFLVFVPTSFNGTSVNLLILKSSLALFCIGRYLFNDWVIEGRSDFSGT
jgi:hypothetical protein